MTSIVGSRARVLIWITALALAGTTGLQAQEQERTEEEDREIVSLATIVGAALQGQIVPTEEPFEWANDYLKSSEQTTFIPFTLSVEQAKLSTPAVAMYIFVAEAGAAGTPAADGGAVPQLPEPAFDVSMSWKNMESAWLSFS